jgi:hypothetical protein
MPRPICIKTSCRCAVRAIEEDCLFVREEEVVAGRVRDGCGRLRCEEDVEFVDSGLEVQGAFGIPVSVVRMVQRRWTIERLAILCLAMPTTHQYSFHWAA